MSSHTFDPNKITVEDIFRAKRARRQLLAKLPLEEKIKIVERLQTLSAAMENEKLVFEAFLKAYPNFAGETLRDWGTVQEWYVKHSIPAPLEPFDKRPDIIAVTASGRKIGVELKSWVNREQIAEARKQERIQDNILKAMGEQLPNKTLHLGYVRLSAKQVRFDFKDTAQFREQILALIQQVDGCWLQQLDAYQEQFLDKSDFTGFPILGKYLHYIQFHPGTRRPSEGDWIGFHSRGGAYSPNEMLGTLSRALLDHRTDKRYKDLRQQVGLDEVYLLVHYDFKAFAYNAPFDAPNFGFKEAAKFASEVLKGDGGYFDRVFLFHFLWGQEEACGIDRESFLER